MPLALIELLVGLLGEYRAWRLMVFLMEYGPVAEGWMGVLLEPNPFATPLTFGRAAGIAAAGNASGVFIRSAAGARMTLQEAAANAASAARGVPRIGDEVTHLRPQQWSELVRTVRAPGMNRRTLSEAYGQALARVQVRQINSLMTGLRYKWLGEKVAMSLEAKRWVILENDRHAAILFSEMTGKMLTPIPADALVNEITFSKWVAEWTRQSPRVL